MIRDASIPLLFMRYEPHTEWTTNRFGIPEPIFDATLARRPDELDLVFTPLVAFNDAGHRLGMGGGYYDRSFAFLKTGLKNKPHLIGLAYDFQHLENSNRFVNRSWDIAMHAVVTEKKIYTFDKRVSL